MYDEDKDNILIIDSACDQSMVGSGQCHVMSSTNLFYNVDGALAGMYSSTPLQVKNVAVLITNPYTQDKIIGVINQALFIPDTSHHEALLQPNQARSFGTKIDDCAKHHFNIDGKPGKQCIKVPGHEIPLLHDGWKAYLSISKPSSSDLESYDIVEFTSPLPYDPTNRLNTRRVTGYKDENIQLWRSRLGFNPPKVILKTLQNTSQLISVVEAERRELMRDHRLTRLYPLRPHRINDVCFTDTFFSNLTSVRGYSKFQLYALRDCKVDYVYLMKKKSQAPDTFADFIRYVGAPNYMISDHAKELMGDEWLKVARRAMIETCTSEPHHQNENLAERRGGALKDNLQILFMNTPWAPLRYWCYGIEFLEKVRRCLAQRSLNWKTGEEELNGETTDISIFRFPWFCPIWFYDPKSKMPQLKMRPGFFLGIDENVGDSFCYKILPYSDVTKVKGRYVKHLTRSVIRLRNIAKDKYPPTCKETADTLKFFDYDGNELIGDYELKPVAKNSEENTTTSTNDSVFNNAEESDDSTIASNSDESLNSVLQPTTNDNIITSDIPLDELLIQHNNSTATPDAPSNTIPFENCNNLPIISQTQDSTTDSDISLPATMSDSITGVDSDMESLKEDNSVTADDLNHHFIEEDDDNFDI